MMKKDFKLFFDEPTHKYTDVYGNTYTSVTTVIGKYKEGFDNYSVAKACATIGRNPNHPDYLKYKGKSAKRLLVEWDKTKVDACERGNVKHNYFETSIKQATGYKKIKGVYVNSRIYTIPEVISNPDFGVLDLDYFEKQGVKKEYPLIFNVISQLVSKGFRVYAEVGVFDLINLISGLIDVFLYRPEDNSFIILDWKTNNAPIRFDAGYFKKDINGNITNEFVPKDKRFKYPISHLPESKGNEYSLQLSTYAHLASKFNIEFKGSILFHITHNTDENNLPIVTSHNLPDLRDDVKVMIEHHSKNNNKKKIQGLLFNNLKTVY